MVENNIILAKSANNYSTDLLIVNLIINLEKLMKINLVGNINFTAPLSSSLYKNIYWTQTKMLTELNFIKRKRAFL